MILKEFRLKNRIQDSIMSFKTRNVKNSFIYLLKSSYRMLGPVRSWPINQVAKKFGAGIADMGLSSKTRARFFNHLFNGPWSYWHEFTVFLMINSFNVKLR